MRATRNSMLRHSLLADSKFSSKGKSSKKPELTEEKVRNEKESSILKDIALNSKAMAGLTETLHKLPEKLAELKAWRDQLEKYAVAATVSSAYGFTFIPPSNVNTGLLDKVADAGGIDKFTEILKKNRELLNKESNDLVDKLNKLNADSATSKPSMSRKS